MLSLCPGGGEFVLSKNSPGFAREKWSDLEVTDMVHSLSSGKVEMFLCAACYAFTPHVNAWKR